MTTTEPDVLDFPGAEALTAAGLVDPPSASAVAVARAAVREAVARDTADAVALVAPDPADAVPLRPRGWVRRRFVGAALAVAAVTATLLVYPTVSVDGGPPAASADAAAFLNRVADTAADGDKSAADAPYWKVRMRTTGMVNGRGSRVQTTWYSRTATYSRSSPGAETKICHDGFCKFPGGMVWTIGKTKLTWDDLGKLPTDPAVLKTRLLGDAGSGSGSTGSLYNRIVNLIAGSPASPALRAALFEILAGMDDVHLVGPAKDSAGRQGTAVEWQGPKMRSRLIVDPRTSTVLEFRQAGFPKPDSRFATTYLYVGPAQKLG
ncbi:CU044_5270 family protein [Streptomyces sp. NPDC058683]|uniref:CU044_5270 family protein n=1 Tax=Streptomyces sp. NPDC058683 TaxID=3346597 RepID=UPI003651FEF8